MTEDSAFPLPVWDALLAHPTTGTWGTGTSRVTFGGGVIDDLVAGLYAHGESVRRPVVLGCVPWLTSTAVARALCDQEAVCIVVDKKGTDDTAGRMYPAVRHIDRRARPIDQSYLAGFDVVSTRVNSQPRVVDMSEFPHDDAFGPVRVAGWYGEEPLLHAKLAVCCDAYFGEDEWGRESGGLRPICSWVGSANWTVKASKHLETGAWIHDRSFSDTALDFVLSLIGISEPLGSQMVCPDPEYAEVDLDVDAIGDYVAQFGRWGEYGDEGKDELLEP